MPLTLTAEGIMKLYNKDKTAWLVGKDGAIVINGESESYVGVPFAISKILESDAVGEPLQFEQIEITCDCDNDCGNILIIHCDGTVEVEKQGCDIYATQIDPRYCASIYRHVKAEAELEAERQAEAYSLAENEHYYSYFQQQMLAEYAAIEANVDIE